MKITKNRLKQIIKEELKKILEGNEIPFPTGRVSAPTYKGKGEVIKLDPLKDMKNAIFTFLQNTTSIDQNSLKQNLDSIFFGLDKDKADELHDKIFIKAVDIGPEKGNTAERVLKVIKVLGTLKTAQEREDYLKKEKNK